MGIDPAASSSSFAMDNQSAHSSAAGVPTEDELTQLFEEAMRRNASSSSSSSSSKPSITKEEQHKFLKAMQEPAFRSLLNEYMQEISDPAHRAETEKYLAQLEKEQRVPDDKLLITPTPGFVVKTKWLGHEKVFVNVCSSEQLQPPSSTKVDTGKQSGTSWRLPYSMGPERREHDKAGGSVLTYDVCFHPRTLQFATLQKPYRDMVVHTCLDAVEAMLRKAQHKPDGVLQRDYHVLKGVLYKSGEPVTMCLTTKPETHKPTSGKQLPASERVEPPPPAEDSNKSDATLRHSTKDTGARPLIEEVASINTTLPRTMTMEAEGRPTLEFRIVYRGRFEMMDHMQATRRTPDEPNRPRELVVEIALPAFTSAKGMDLDVNEHTVKVGADGYEPLEIKLPFAVVEAKGSAKFDKKARKLVVTLPVQPPPKPVVKKMVIDENSDGEDEEREHEGEEPATANEPRTLWEEATTPARSEPPSDAFAMLRETAMMVANDPMYLPRGPSSPVTEPVAVEQASSSPPSLEDKVKAYIANDVVFDDLPPLESCSEDEADDEDAAVTTPVVAVAAHETEPVAVRTPLFTVKETEACKSYLVAVASVATGAAQLDFPSQSSFRLRLTTATEQYELSVDDVGFEIDTYVSEVDVATENLVVILQKKVAEGSNGINILSVEKTTTTASVPPLPVVRFQNDLLYELD